MKHQSFDMHFFRDRTGKWCMSFTTPSGQRTWRHRLNEVEVVTVRQLAGRMVNMCVRAEDLPLIRFDDAEAP
jgi:hypothetical protein